MKKKWTSNNYGKIWNILEKSITNKITRFKSQKNKEIIRMKNVKKKMKLKINKKRKFKNKLN